MLLLVNKLPLPYLIITTESTLGLILNKTKLTQLSGLPKQLKLLKEATMSLPKELKDSHKPQLFQTTTTE